MNRVHDAKLAKGFFLGHLHAHHDKIRWLLRRTGRRIARMQVIPSVAQPFAEQPPHHLVRFINGYTSHGCLSRRRELPIGRRSEGENESSPFGSDVVRNASRFQLKYSRCSLRTAGAPARDIIGSSLTGFRLTQ